MRRYEAVAAAALAVAAVILLYAALGSEGQGKVCLKGICFEVSLATTFFQQSKGLMFVTHMGQDKGMLFVFGSDGDYPFWMQNTYIPLDIVWISSQDHVVFIAKNAQPCGLDCSAIDPGVNSRYVLEVNAGNVGRIGLAVGDNVTIEY